MAVRESRNPTAEYADVRDSTRETKDRFPGDTFLRQFDFVILARPADGPAVWVRHGHQYTQDEAVRLAKLLRERAIRELESKSGDLP